MIFTQLRAFHAVATEGGFTRGAARLGLSQPAVTVQVQALERAYGVELFRRGQGVALTDFGRLVFAHSRRIFAQLEDLDELFEAAGSLRIGKLVLGADGPFAVMDLLAAFTARHPGVEVAMRLGNAARVLSDLRERHTDVALLNLIAPADDVYARAVLRDRLVVLVSETHPWAGREGIALDELAAAPLILREPGSATRAVLLEALEGARLSPRIVLELGSREAVREAVLAGLGVGTVFAQELVPDPRLRALAITGADLGATASLVCLAERRGLGAVQAFFAILDQAPLDQAAAR
jgi:aminoethylphosphonate catabolism LysR family transcriptional regulator